MQPLMCCFSDHKCPKLPLALTDFSTLYGDSCFPHLDLVSLYFFATNFLAVLFCSLSFADYCVFICFSAVTVVVIPCCIVMLLLFLLETVSDIMPHKAVVTQDRSTPDVQSKHIMLPMPAMHLSVGFWFCVGLLSLFKNYPAG